MKILWKVKKMNNTDYHIPVMKHEAVSHLLSDRDGIYIDATLGYGGHSRHILKKTSSKSKLFAIDKDIDAIEFNKKELTPLIAAKKINQPIIIISGHIGSWEAVRAVLKNCGLTSGALYKRNRNIFYERLHLKAIKQSIISMSYCILRRNTELQIIISSNPS